MMGLIMANPPLPSVSADWSQKDIKNSLVARKFQKRTENFVCEHCRFKVKGNGYTNHCPKCLYSKHVDINPGDRAAICGGLMRPVGVEMLSEGYILTHRCEKCGAKKKNKAAPTDNFEAILNLTKGIAKI